MLTLSPQWRTFSVVSYSVRLKCARELIQKTNLVTMCKRPKWGLQETRSGCYLGGQGGRREGLDVVGRKRGQQHPRPSLWSWPSQQCGSPPQASSWKQSMWRSVDRVLLGVGKRPMGSARTHSKLPAAAGLEAPSLSTSPSIHLGLPRHVGPAGHSLAPVVSFIRLNCSRKRTVAPL